MKPRIRSSVGVVVNEGQIEFFKGNIRKSLIVKIDEKVSKLICSLDGESTVDEIADKYKMNNYTKKKFLKFLKFLKTNSIIVDDLEIKKTKDREIYSRVFSMLEDYFSSEEKVQMAWNNIKKSKVLVIGIGAVGSWIAANLIQSGVENLILMDNDKIEISNLHRQWGYIEEDIGKFKVEVLKKRLLDINEKANISIVKKMLCEETLNFFDGEKLDLIIDCADKPTVDQTAIWIGEYCMKKNIPHIIAGGYNLHVSLIGQTIIPYKTACVKCFEKQLKEQNDLDIANMKKLAIAGRKIGSLGPMCSISSSFSSLEAIKVLTKTITPTNINRRGEFNIYDMDVKYKEYKKLDNCEWCGKKGKYKKNK
ncbi:MAG: ThiF family adenylyltransferase [Fusobacterium sp. JB019]|nr:ThiF family adenylyltransferase [Fusobacterium sp. JB019]